MASLSYGTNIPDFLLPKTVEEVEKRRKGQYTKRDKNMIISVLKDFGCSGEELVIPADVVSLGQLQSWKNKVINKKLAEAS